MFIDALFIIAKDWKGINNYLQEIYFVYRENKKTINSYN